MEHLTANEILKFASASSFDVETEAVVNRVNRHILECGECAARVRAAASYCDVVTALSANDFAASDTAGSVYDISPEQVALEVESLFGREGAYNY